MGIGECVLEHVESMLGFSVPGESSAPDLPLLSMSLPNIFFSLPRATDGIQWHCNVYIVFNEFCILTVEPQEASDIFTIFGLRPMHFCNGLMFLGVDAIIVNVKGTKIDFLTSPGTFRTFGI